MQAHANHEIKLRQHRHDLLRGKIGKQNGCPILMLHQGVDLLGDQSIVLRRTLQPLEGNEQDAAIVLVEKTIESGSDFLLPELGVNSSIPGTKRNRDPRPCGFRADEAIEIDWLLPDWQA